MQRSAAAGIIQRLRERPRSRIDDQQIVHILDKDSLAVGRQRKINRAALEFEPLALDAKDLCGGKGLPAERQRANLLAGSGPGQIILGETAQDQDCRPNQSGQAPAPFPNTHHKFHESIRAGTNNSGSRAIKEFDASRRRNQIESIRVVGGGRVNEGRDARSKRARADDGPGGQRRQGQIRGCKD